MKIKALIGVALLAGACVLSANAQVGEQRHNLAIGINGGINLNKASFSPTVKQKNLMGINGGITARYISERYFKMICGGTNTTKITPH